MPRRTAPADGERNALSGFLPQYKVAAEKVLRELTAGTLESVVLGDREAGRLDDFQLVCIRRNGLRLDAYQVKWGRADDPLIDSEFRGLLLDMILGLRKIREAQRRRRQTGARPVERSVAHLYSNRPASTASLRGDGLAGQGLNLDRFFREIWGPAGEGAFESTRDIPAHWHGYIRALAESCSLQTDALLNMASNLSIELCQRLPEEKLTSDLAAERFRRDIEGMAAGMKAMVIDDTVPETLDVSEFLGRLGPEWLGRGRRRSKHEFPVPAEIKPIEASVSKLQSALDDHDSGYIFLLGSPGSGKSTLLTQMLRVDPRLAARYYAYVPGDDTRTRGEAHAFLHDLVFTLSGERSFLPPDSDISLLRDRLYQELAALSERSTAQGSSAIVLIDGLDHVLRDPLPHDGFLAELPPPDRIPDGVLLVIGTRTREDLPKHVAPAATPQRVIETEALSRTAVIALAEQAGIVGLAEQVFQASGGHPLLTQTFIKLAKSLPAERQAEALSTLPRLDGEAMRYYQSVWVGFEDDDELVDILSVVSRLRVPIDLDWLRLTGSSSIDIRKLERLKYLFREGSTGRWTFFHDSFREFLRERTSERDGKVVAAKELQAQGEIADRCIATEQGRPEHWEQIHHLLRAGRTHEVLERATPQFFRAQYDAARPVGNIQKDIRDAAAALAEIHEPVGLVRLALSAIENETRDFSFPHGTEFAKLLVALDRPDLAMAHVANIDDAYMDRNRKQSAMRLVRVLKDAGYPDDAESLFEVNEPLEWLGGRSEDPRATDGPWQTLYSWVRAAVVMRGAEYVLAGVDRVDLGEDDAHWRSSEDGDTQLRGFKMNLVGCAAEEALLRDQREDYETLLAALDQSEPEGADQIADCLFAELERTAKGETDQRLLIIDRLLGVADLLSGRRRMRVGAILGNVGRSTEAERQLASLPRPSIPERESLRENGPGWNYLYSYYRLRAQIGKRDDPARVITVPNEGRRIEAYLARHVVAQATLHGRVWAGEEVMPGELVRAVRSFHAYLDNLAREERFGTSGLGGVRKRLAHTAISLAQGMGREALEELWHYWKKRWEDDEPDFLNRGIDLIGAFRDAGIGEVEVRAQLKKLQAAMKRHDDLAADDWVLLALAWIESDERAMAEKALGRAMWLTTGVGFRKDYQLNEWLKLLRPLLGTDEGGSAARWLAEGIIGVSHRIEAGAPWEAGRLLVKEVAEASPSLAFECAQRLTEGAVLEIDDVVLALLEGTASHPTALWWTVLSEMLVGIGAKAPKEAITVAAKAEADKSRVLGLLRATSERVSIEGRPSERIGWRNALVDAASEAGIVTNELGLTAADLEIGDETPSADHYSSETTGNGRDELTVDELVAAIESDGSDYTTAKAVTHRIGELSDDQIARVDLALKGGEREAAFAASLAERAHAAGDREEAWHQAERSLVVGTASDWQRHWAGGPVIDAAAILKAIDADRARRLLFERFAAIASGDQFLLSAVGRDLSDFLDLFGPFDQAAIADSVWEFMTVLLSRDSQPGAPKIPRPAAEAEIHRALDSTTVDKALVEVLAQFLRSPYTLGWTCGQRALLVSARATPDSQLLNRMLVDPTIDTSIVLAVLATLANNCFKPSEDLLNVLHEIAVGPRLDLRAGARDVLGLFGEDPPDAEGKPLSAGFGLHIVSRVSRERAEEARIGPADLESMIGIYQKELENLAKTSDVDTSTLRERVGVLAEQEEAGQGSDQLPARGPFGWGYLKPSARRVRRAVGQICAELFDAGKVHPYDALWACGLAPLYDVSLLQMRPQTRPQAVVPILTHKERESHFRDWFLPTEAGAERLAQGHDDWHVIGEVSQLAIPGSQYPEERREQGLVTSDEADRFKQTWLNTAEEHTKEPPRFDGSLIVQRTHIQSGAPDWWVAFHSGAAQKVGLAPEPSNPFTWTLDGEVMVQSVWWRSGFRWWPANSPTDEVGEGWLVLARPQIIEKLKSTFGNLRMSWKVTTSMRIESSGEQSVRAQKGKIQL